MGNCRNQAELDAIALGEMPDPSVGLESKLVEEFKGVSPVPGRIEAGDE